MLQPAIHAFNQWKEAQSERRSKKLNSKAGRLLTYTEALNSYGEHDVLFLQEKGFVKVRATGFSITSVQAEIENLVDKAIHVVIQPGTYFVARGAFQNMATRRVHVVRVSPNAITSASISACCINAHRPIPDQTNHFRGVRRVSSKLVRVLKATEGTSPMAVQAAVWALTDLLSAESIKSRLWRGLRPAITDADIAEARKILDGLNIRHMLK